MQRARLIDERELGDQRLGRANPADAHAGRNRLGERAQIGHARAFEAAASRDVERLQAPRRLAGEAQRAIGGVLDHDSVEFPRELQYVGALALRRG